MATKKGKRGALNHHDADSKPYCSLPIVPNRPLDDNTNPNRVFLIRYIEKKWVNGTLLHYHFLDLPQIWQGASAQKNAVREAFKTWKDIGIGLDFREVSDPAEAEIRIAFEPGGSWSYVGRDAIDLIKDLNERTMNFGWDLTTPYGRDTALHEIGHALGFPHEHQNPKTGIVWDEEAVYAYFGAPPNNWDRDTAYYNIIRKIPEREVEGSQWDKNSIMHYQLPAGVILIPEQYQTQALIPAPGLSDIDKKEVRTFYPPQTNVQTPELIPFLSKYLDINPGQQLDFAIKPDISRTYRLQTFGQLDTVVVLFEQSNGEPVYLAGDDDSGGDRNAHITIRLLRGHSYILRVRLYYSNSSGHGAVMLW